MKTIIEVSLTSEVLEPGALDIRLASYRDSGARVVFAGQARDEGGAVKSLFVEHFPGMAETSIRTICERASEKWSLNRIVVVHRTGHVTVGDDLVQVAVSADHRSAAFTACEYIMDYLKSNAPLWKKEIGPDSARWVDAKSSDVAALRRWSE